MSAAECLLLNLLSDSWEDAKASPDRFAYVADHNKSWFRELRQAAYKEWRCKQEDSASKQSPSGSSKPHLDPLDIPLDASIQPATSTPKGGQQDHHGHRQTMLCHYGTRPRCNTLNRHTLSGKSCYFCHFPSEEDMYIALSTSPAVRAALDKVEGGEQYNTVQYCEEADRVCVPSLAHP